MMKHKLTLMLLPYQSSILEVIINNFIVCIHLQDDNLSRIANSM